MFFKIPTRFVSEELELLKTFHQQQEEQISDFITNIDQHIQTEWQEGWHQNYAGDPGELIEYPVERLGNVTEQEYNLREIFTGVMPMYQRQAMLLSMWALYECEFTAYYSHVASMLGRRATLPNQNGPRVSQLTHITNCFKRLGCLDIESDEFIQAVERLNGEVRLVRNAWAHNGGKLKNNDAIADVEGITLLTGQVNLSSNYINQVSELMALVTSELSDSVVEVVAQHKFEAGN
ncbi:hypothetical protein AB4163_21510 [Vibrio splendidus]|uniref:hypothetical protein n=1 Tax=Vibrio TaxID=662 RepID=UPI000EF4F044|nr:MULTISPECIES: hypothetical protein [Vibrio]MCC4880226.1 hypothetical protein [Vibrio splendidus]RLQ18787.1 hypothetical protein AYK60_01560 [Vibrio sp. SBT000027]TKF61182.1 hypothetical protein FCV63_00785 [Vibrio lentus]